MFVTLPSHRKPRTRWITPLLVAVLLAGHLWVSTRPGPAGQALLENWAALAGGAGLDQTWRLLWSDWRWPRLFSAIGLHADWLHLAGNLVFLVIFGLPGERIMGPWRFLALFALGGAFANFGAILAAGPERLVIGASGAVSAVIGAYLALFPKAKLGVVLPLGLFMEFVRAPASLFIGSWVILQVVFAYIGPAFGEVAWLAHLGGFLFGAVFGLSSRAGIARRMRRERGF